MNAEESLDVEEDFYRFVDDFDRSLGVERLLDGSQLHSPVLPKHSTIVRSRISLPFNTGWETSLMPSGLAVIACLGGWVWSLHTFLHAGRGALALALGFLCSPFLHNMCIRYSLLSHMALIYGFLQGFPQHEINHAFYITMLVVYIDGIWTYIQTKYIKRHALLVVISTAQLAANLAMSSLQGPFHLLNDYCFVTITITYILYCLVYPANNCSHHPTYNNATLVHAK
jgi:hypothetical protein